MVKHDEKVTGHHPGLAGKFVRVTMVNFMCHGHLVVELGPRINYIIGENGSGKSAVLTALTVTLGAKAKSVGRSSTRSLKGMIKSGTNVAKLSVVISNDGDEAFSPEVYGKSIVVERTLVNAGTNTLKIKNERGETIGTKNDDLERITDFFAIDVDNPIVVMTQEQAKGFLNSGDDGKKYEFFLRATLLQAVQERLTISRNYMSDMKEVLKEHAENIPLLEKNLEHLTHEVNAYQRVQDMRSKAQDFLRRFGWSQVVQMEKQLDAQREEYETKIAKKASQLQKIEDAKHVRDVALTKKAEFDGRHDEFTAKLEVIQKEKRAADSEYKEASRQLQKVQTDKLSEETKMKQLLKKAKDTESKIQAVLDAQKGETTHAEEGIRRLNEALMKAKAAVVQGESEVERLELGRQEAVEEQARCSRKQRAFEIQIDNMRKQISTLKNTSTNKLVLYHARMPVLVDSIERRRGEFSKPPIGPVGTYIILKKQEWITPVEECLNNVLTSFVVASPQDMDKIRKMAQESGVPNVSVMCVNFNRQRYNIPRERVPDPNEFTTVESAIECTHDAVFNLCVDQCQIESSVLMKDEAPATALFNSGAARAKNVGSVYTLQRKIFLTGNTTRNEAFKNKNTAHKLGADSKSEIARFEEEIKDHQANAKEVSAAQAAAAKVVREVEGSIRKVQDDLKSLNKTHFDARRALDQAKIDVEGTSVPAYDVSALQDELDSVNVELKKHKSAVAALEIQLEERQKLFDVAKHTADEKLSLAESLRKDVQRLNDDMGKAPDVDHTNKEIERLQQKLSEAEEQVLKAEKLMNASLDKLKVHEEELKSNLCTREEALAAGDITTEPDKLMRMYETTKTQAKEEEQRHKRPYAEVSDELSSVQNKLIKLTDGYKKSEKVCKLIRAGIKERQKAMTLRARDYSKIVSHRFNYYMSKKGHSGRILIDFEVGSLQLEVKDGEKGQTVRDMRSMSGGERSYSTLAFNLSLGDTNESPFSAMDEFDVFMDAVNRKVSIESLLKFARIHDDKQFVFITPQDISAVDAEAEDVKIMKMAPARVDA